MHYFQAVAWWLGGLKYRIWLLCVIYTACTSICWLSCSMPSTPLFHQQPVSAEESEKQRQQEIAWEEHERLQIRILMLFCGKGLVWVPACRREQGCIWILNRRERKYCAVKGLLPGKQTSNGSVSMCDNVPPGGGGNCETFKNWNFNNSGITYSVLTRSALLEKVWLEIGKNVPIHVQGWNAAGYVYWPKITLSCRVSSVTEMYSSSLGG